MTADTWTQPPAAGGEALRGRETQSQQLPGWHITCAHIHTHAHTHTHMFTCACVHILRNTDSTHLLTHAYTCAVHMCLRSCAVLMYEHAHTYTCPQAHTYLHILSHNTHAYTVHRFTCACTHPDLCVTCLCSCSTHIRYLYAHTCTQCSSLLLARSLQNWGTSSCPAESGRGLGGCRALSGGAPPHQSPLRAASGPPPGPAKAPEPVL